jgi:hypothetical protein
MVVQTNNYRPPTTQIIAGVCISLLVLIAFTFGFFIWGSRRRRGTSNLRFLGEAREWGSLNQGIKDSFMLDEAERSRSGSVWTIGFPWQKKADEADGRAEKAGKGVDRRGSGPDDGGSKGAVDRVVFDGMADAPLDFFPWRKGKGKETEWGMGRKQPAVDSRDGNTETGKHITDDASSATVVGDHGLDVGGDSDWAPEASVGRLRSRSRPGEPMVTP